MSNKFLFFPLFGLFIPLFLYTMWHQVGAFFNVTITPVGEVELLSTAEQADSFLNKSSDPMVFVGDVLLARNVEFLLLSKGENYPFKNMPSIFAGAPVVVGNFEAAILKNHIKTPSYVTTFSVNGAFIPLLRKAGLTHVSLANNHSLDYGPVNFMYTLNTLTGANITALGHPQVVASSSTTIIESGDYQVGLLVLNQVFSSSTWAEILVQIEQLVATTDYQLVYVHWGEEYQLAHSANQELLAKKLIDAGVDAVVGHHPHVTQDIQIYNHKPIFYSLGNFLFDQYFSVDVEQGLVLRLNLENDQAEFTLLPISSEGTHSQPALMPATEAELFLKNLARRSDAGYAENIALGKIILPF